MLALGLIDVSKKTLLKVLQQLRQSVITCVSIMQTSWELGTINPACCGNIHECGRGQYKPQGHQMHQSSYCVLACAMFSVALYV